MKYAKSLKKQTGNAAVAGLIWISIVGWGLAAWFTHLYVCFTEEAWGFLIAGAIMFPIAMVHGTGVWFGAW